MMCQLFESMFSFKELKLSRRALLSFLNELSSHYHSNPFHNFQHACTVTHVLFKIFEETNALEHVSKLQLFATMIAAIGPFHS